MPLKILHLPDIFFKQKIAGLRFLMRNNLRFLNSATALISLSRHLLQSIVNFLIYSDAWYEYFSNKWNIDYPSQHNCGKGRTFNITAQNLNRNKILKIKKMFSLSLQKCLWYNRMLCQDKIKNIKNLHFVYIRI